jgi:hypothetical protein
MSGLGTGSACSATLPAVPFQATICRKPRLRFIDSIEKHLADRWSAVGLCPLQHPHDPLAVRRVEDVVLGTARSRGEVVEDKAHASKVESFQLGISLDWMHVVFAHHI